MPTLLLAGPNGSAKTPFLNAALGEQAEMVVFTTRNGAAAFADFG